MHQIDHQALLDELVAKGAIKASSTEDLVKKLPTQRIVWVMLTAGEPTVNAIKELSNYLEPGGHRNRRVKLQLQRICNVIQSTQAERNYDA